MATVPFPDGGEPPLSIEPLVGWRVWRLELGPRGPRLRSIFQDTLWPPGDVMRAECPRGHREGGPQHGCSCGIYAASTPEALAQAGVFNTSSGVVGAIAMWGTVVEHARGARAEFAYPARLRLVCSVCLSRGAGAVDPVEVVTDAGGGRPVCATHAAGLRGSGRPAGELQAELLAAYGVDVMPIERVERSLRRRPARSGIGQVPIPTSPKALGLAVGVGLIRLLGLLMQSIITLVMLGWALWIGFAILSGVLRAVGLAHDGGTPPAIAIPSPPVVDPLPAGGIRPLASPAVAAEPYRRAHVAVPRIGPSAVVCGSAAGGTIDLARCSDPGADLIGFAELARPRGAAADCAPAWDTYSRGHHYWICWIDPFGTADRWTHAPNPWSIPEAQGGAG